MMQEWLAGVLGCPAGSCPLHATPAGSLCHRCGRRFDLDKGLVVDRRLAPLANHLETIDYDGGHGVSPTASRAFGARWMGLLRDEFGHRSDLDVVELGAGTGLLTVGLALQDGIRHLLVSDVSAPFLRTALARVEAALPPGADHRDRLGFVLCSLDDLPFRPQSCDAVVANSVLHHVYDWQAALLRIRRILKPGGVAIFGEPVIQGQAFVGAIVRIMADLDRHSSEPSFSPDEHRRLRDLVTLCTREFWTGAAQIKRDTADDKHLFDLDALRDTARTLGFTSMTVADAPVRDGLLGAVGSALTIMGLPLEPLSRYGHLCLALQEQVVDQLPGTVSPPFVHLVFRR